MVFLWNILKHQMVYFRVFLTDKSYFSIWSRYTKGMLLLFKNVNSGQRWTKRNKSFHKKPFKKFNFLYPLLVE